jgi:hypothetical protein
MELSDALVALVTLDEDALNRRVAGLSAGARIAAEAQAAGAQALWIVGDTRNAISAESWQEIRRTCGSLEVLTLSADEAEVRLAGQPGRPLLLLSATHLVPASLYPRLLAEGSLGSGGRVVAAATRAGSPLPLLGGTAHDDHPEIVDLRDVACATRTIVRCTAKPSDGIVSRHLNRPISQRISTALLLASGSVRPWHMTMLTALLTLVMFPILIFGGSPGLILGAFLFHLTSVLDGVDGEIARATGRSSISGAVLDTR